MWGILILLFACRLAAWVAEWNEFLGSLMMLAIVAYVFLGLVLYVRKANDA